MNAACSLTSPSPFLALSLIVTQTPFFDEDDKKAFAQVETLSLMLCLHPFSCEPVPRYKSAVTSPIPDGITTCPKEKKTN